MDCAKLAGTNALRMLRAADGATVATTAEDATADGDAAGDA